MTVNKNVENGKMSVSIVGRVDTVTAPQLEAALDLAGVKELELDCAGLEYISSAGLRVLLSAQKTMNRQGTMVLYNVNENVTEVFDVTGFLDLLTIR